MERSDLGSIADDILRIAQWTAAFLSFQPGHNNLDFPAVKLLSVATAQLWDVESQSHSLLFFLFCFVFLYETQ